VSTISDEFHPAATDASGQTPHAGDNSVAGGGGALASAPDDSGIANLEKIRDILFGAHMRNYDRRLAGLEERLVRETAALNEEVRKRLAALEDFVKRETDSLNDRLKAEFEARSDATAALSRELRESAGTLERRAGSLDDQLGRAQRELRQQILEQHQRLSDEIQARVDDVLSRLHKESTDLRSDKADRATIAALLTEMALRLNNELSLPGLSSPPR
jgi:hypothetical protein